MGPQAGEEEVGGDFGTEQADVNAEADQHPGSAIHPHGQAGAFVVEEGKLRQRRVGAPAGRAPRLRVQAEVGTRGAGGGNRVVEACHLDGVEFAHAVDFPASRRGGRRDARQRAQRFQRRRGAPAAGQRDAEQRQQHYERSQSAARMHLFTPKQPRRSRRTPFLSQPLSA